MITILILCTFLCNKRKDEIMRNSKITAIVLSAIIGIGVGTGGTLVYENNQEAKQISKLEQTTKANAVE